jgi:hypothetical protein
MKKNPKTLTTTLTTILFLSTQTLTQVIKNTTLSKFKPYINTLSFKKLHKTKEMYGFVWSASVLNTEELADFWVNFNLADSFIGFKSTDTEAKVADWGISKCGNSTFCSLGGPEPYQFIDGTMYMSAYQNGQGMQFRMEEGQKLQFNGTRMPLYFLNCTLEESPLNNGKGYGMLGMGPGTSEVTYTPSAYLMYFASDDQFHWNNQIVSWKFWINNNHDGPNIEPKEGQFDGSQLVFNVFNEGGRYYPLSFPGYQYFYGSDWVINKANLTTWNFDNDTMLQSGVFVIGEDIEICMNLNHSYIIGFRDKELYTNLLENMYRAICGQATACPTGSTIEYAPQISLGLNYDDIRILYPNELFYDDGKLIQPTFGLDEDENACLDQNITLGRNFFNKFAFYVLDQPNHKAKIFSLERCTEPEKDMPDYMLWNVLFLFLLIVVFAVVKFSLDRKIADENRKVNEADGFEVEEVKSKVE